MADYRNMSIGELLSLTPPGWGGALLDGLVLSLQVAASGYLIGLVIGMAGAAGKISGGPVTRDLLTGYTTVIRAVPELVLILLVLSVLARSRSRSISEKSNAFPTGTSRAKRLPRGDVTLAS